MLRVNAGLLTPNGRIGGLDYATVNGGLDNATMNGGLDNATMNGGLVPIAIGTAQPPLYILTNKYCPVVEQLAPQKRSAGGGAETIRDHPEGWRALAARAPGERRTSNAEPQTPNDQQTTISTHLKMTANEGQVKSLDAFFRSFADFRPFS